MNDPAAVDSEGVITFSSIPVEVQVHVNPSSSTLADDDISDNCSVLSANSNNDAPFSQQNTNDNSCDQMTHMMTGIAVVLKDVMKELKELKQVSIKQTPTVYSYVPNDNTTTQP